jgi:glycosyltransferase involved in cell wall biosynthesis
VADRLRIAIIADPFLPVPPIGYGGIERIIDFLIKHLVEKGHHVILIGHKDSVVPVPLIPYGNQDSKIKHLHNLFTINKIRKFRPDIIHSFGRLAYLLPFLQSSIPKIMSYQREPTIAQIKKAVSISKRNTLSFTGCSNYISNQISGFAEAIAIHNGFPMDVYQPNFTYNSSAPLVFLGRIEHIKGTHIAIEVALKTNSDLIIAGNIPVGEMHYFKEKIAPFLSEKIKYIGVVNDLQKNALLQQAKALLMPILWNEPFGIVMIEAMACGTPVLGFERGGLAEIVKNGISGFVCNSLLEMISSVVKLYTLPRKDVWQYAFNNFNSKHITDKYLELYYQKHNTLKQQ